MATNVANPNMLPQRRSWSRGAALVLAGMAVTVGLAVGLGSATPESPSPAHPRVADHGIVDTSRPQDLANDRHARHHGSDSKSPVTGSIRAS